MPRRRREAIAVPTGGVERSNGASPEATEEEAGTELDASGDGGGTSIGDGTDNDGDGGRAGDGDSGAGSRHPRDDGDPRIIRDKFGNPTFSATGRLRKRRANSGSGGGGSNTSAPKAVKKVPVDAMARLLVMGHGIAANFTRTPELEINTSEARMLADPLSELLVLYEIEPDPRIMAMMELGLAASYVYGPRFTMIRIRLRAEARAKAAAKKATEERVLNTTSEGGETYFAPVPHNPNGGPLGGFPETKRHK
jgi:hypothetical protein